jgi:phage terminase large subunit-like protein
MTETSREALIERLAELSDEDIIGIFAAMAAEERRGFPYDWGVHGRPAQQAPAGDWRIWLLMAGRGFGKTRTGAEWVRRLAADGSARIALVGASLHEARSVMVEGESGLLAIAPYCDRPTWHPSLRRLTWNSGAEATLFGAAEPESLRGPQFSHAWADEIAKWPMGVAAWDNLEMALRLGAHPRAVATTTPRPVPLVRRLLAREGRDLIRSGGRTADNIVHLAPGFLVAMDRNYGGTRLGRQELDGELVDDVEGALWTRDLIERCRVAHVPAAADGAPVLRRVVVGVDPPAGPVSGTGGDACGIVVAGIAADERGYVIADATVEGRGPEGWARAVAGAAMAHGADRIIAEANNGGAMVASVLRAVDARLPITLVHASLGKSARAEPVAALYESGRVFHRGMFAQLEDQMCGMVTGGGYEGPGRSPDRADALVWALSALMLGKTRGKVGVRGF